MNKKSKNLNIATALLNEFIAKITNQSINDFQTNAEIKDSLKEFNGFSELKKYFDLYIINFWILCVVCELYYDKTDFMNICNSIENSILESLIAKQAKESHPGFSLETVIKNADEIASINEEYPDIKIGEKTITGYRTFFRIIRDKRFKDYYSAFESKGAISSPIVSKFMIQHIFGQQASQLGANVELTLVPIFTLHNSSTFSSCAKLINQIEKD